MVSAIVYLLDYRLLRWRLSGNEVEGDLIWKNLRRYCGWMFVSCIAGVITSILIMQAHNLYIETLVPGISRRRYYELNASSFRNYAAMNIFNSAGLLCEIFAINLLLRRVSDHASHSYYNEARDHVSTGRSTVNKRFDWRDCVGQYALYNMVRALHVFAMVLCALNILARIVAAGFRANTAAIYDQAAAATDLNGGETSSYRDFFNAEATNSIEGHIKSVAVARVIQATVLVLVAFQFLLFFPTCIVMFRRVERRLETLIQEMNLRSDHGNAFLPFEFSPPAADGSHTQVELPIVEVRQFLQTIKSSAASQRMRFIACLAIQLTALIATASHALFYASYSLFIDADFDQNGPCAECDPSCQKLRDLVQTWQNHTPEFVSLFDSLPTTVPQVQMVPALCCCYTAPAYGFTYRNHSSAIYR
jgi:hypothetical protein